LVLAIAMIAFFCWLSMGAHGCEYVRIIGRCPSFVEVALPLKLVEEQTTLKVRLTRGAGEDEWYVYRNAPVTGERTVEGTTYRWKLSFRNGRQSEDFAPCVLEGAIEAAPDVLRVSRIIELTPFRKKDARVVFQARNLSIALRNVDTSEVTPGDAAPDMRETPRPIEPPEPPSETPQPGDTPAEERTPSSAPSQGREPSEKIIYITANLRITFMDKYEPAARFPVDARCPYCGLPFRDH
jgi:hypothetical protein